MTDEWDDDELEIELVPAPDAAARLLALVALARRGFLESGAELGDDSPEGERFDLTAWLREERLLEALTQAERDILDAPIGSLSPDAITDATWGIESAAALAWALGLIPAMPPYDAPIDAASVIDALPAPWARTTEFRNAARLHDEEAIAAALEQAEIWTLRAEQYWWSQDATGQDAAELASVIATMATEAHAARLLACPIENDFPTAGGPYYTLDPDAVDRLERIASSRLAAFRWLCGLPDE